MYNLDNVIGLYYNSVSAISILQNEVKFYEFSQTEFAKLSKAYLTYYSDTENRQLYEYIADSVREEGHPFSGMDNRSGLNVFAALEELSEQLLTFENGNVLCIYSNLLRYREVTKYVEEDLLICAFLAVRFRRLRMLHTNFGWSISINHNNLQLQRIMSRKVSENHFHLFGSAPSFHLLWIYFMNHLDEGVISQFSRDIEKKQRVAHAHYSTNYSEDTFQVRLFKAALIRIVLTIYLLKKNSLYGNELLDNKMDLNLIKRLLVSGNDILAYRNEIQNDIDQIRNLAAVFGRGEAADYALYPVENLFNIEEEKFWFAGERWIMYEMLRSEIMEDSAQFCEAREYYQWFYAYLVIKQNVRSELVQVNNTVGFENFSIYNSRKNVYADEERLVRAAVYGSVESGNIKHLEIRVTPGRSVFENAKELQKIDRAIQCHPHPLSKTDYYYVFHFTKKADDPLEDHYLFDEKHCRHYKKRRQLEQQAKAVCIFREQYREIASDVLGIDACAQEIGCRPEVFAPVFRYLSNHLVSDVLGLEGLEVRQLRMTYHVGEDFLDVVDGLRAVDEAVHFLNLKCGDRIGHGTVLGIDVKEWYRFKQNTIVLTIQDYLDNVVWLYNKLIEYKIPYMENLCAKLLEEFEFYFAKIFLQLEDGNNRELFYYNIQAYYEAWKLRGDEPELYLKGFYEQKLFYRDDWLVNRIYPEKFENRLRHEIGYLYYLYHYDWNVRKNGGKSVQIYVLPAYIEGVCAVQKAMQKEFGTRGIGIEANPSSNISINVIKSYDKHPIAMLYNLGLTSNSEALDECPQISVSINTDDKGVFHTSIENEYALMACAMEKAKDTKGRSLYNRQNVYQWIDNIRMLGIMQSFREPPVVEVESKAFGDGDKKMIET